MRRSVWSRIEMGGGIAVGVLASIPDLPDLLVGFLGLVAAAIVVDGLHRLVREKRHRRALRALFSGVVEQGKALLERSAQADPQTFLAEAEAWGARARGIIKAAYGDEEAARFLDRSGFVLFVSNSMPKLNQQCATFIEGRMPRLADLISRTGSLSLAADFDPRDWDD